MLVKCSKEKTLVKRVAILLSRFVISIFWPQFWKNKTLRSNHLIKVPVQQEQGVEEVPPVDEPQVENLQVGEFSIHYFQLEGDDGDVQLQQVMVEEIEAGQGPGMSTQEFNDRFFL